MLWFRNIVAERALEKAVIVETIELTSVTSSLSAHKVVQAMSRLRSILKGFQFGEKPSGISTTVLGGEAAELAPCESATAKASCFMCFM